MAVGDSRSLGEGQTSVVEFRNVGVSFAGRRVLDGVDASIPAGGLTVFVGPNGAGKTTLLLCVLGEVPHEGEVRIDPAAGERVGYVPQALVQGVRTPITCAEYLALSVSPRPLWLGMGRAMRAAADGVLARVGLDGFGRRRLDELSGGETRRVLLASALLGKPRLLLLDEPAAGVDLRGERLFWEILQDLRLKDGISVVMVSHNLPLAAHYATHVLCVFGGRCIEGAPRAALTSRNLMAVFGAPIHLYPEDCEDPGSLCPECGAFDSERSCHHGACAHAGACLEEARR